MDSTFTEVLAIVTTIAAAVSGYFIRQQKILKDEARSERDQDEKMFREIISNRDKQIAELKEEIKTLRQ